jgi:hypothetical protein
VLETQSNKNPIVLLILTYVRIIMFSFKKVRKLAFRDFLTQDQEILNMLPVLTLSQKFGEHLENA